MTKPQGRSGRHHHRRGERKESEPGIGRAEALRVAEAALIARSGRFAHRCVWAPFVLVGNGEQ